MSVVKFMKPTLSDKELLETLWEQEVFLTEAFNEAKDRLKRNQDAQVAIYKRGMADVR